MDNSTDHDILVLLGMVEMEGFKYVYSVLSIVTYIFIILLSSCIVLVIFTEESLHEPMYVLILNLALTGIFGSSSFFPKLILDLLTSSKTISRPACHIQVLCIVTFTFFELSVFTIMAYDQYLAVSHPLQYVTLMTTEKTVKLLLGSLLFVFTSALIAVVMSARLRLCGNGIKNIFCDNPSFIVLSCVDSTVNNVYGVIVTTTIIVSTTGIIIYCYVWIFIICFRLTRSSSVKAIHTLVTHLLNFSIFMVGVLFIFVRLRLDSSKLPLNGHILLSVCLVVFPPLLNPLIYGIRTKALRVKMISQLIRLYKWKSFIKWC